MLFNLAYAVVHSVGAKKRYEKIVKVMQEKEAAEKKRLSEISITYVETQKSDEKKEKLCK